jgi:multimeric flavodoxin WrbA
MKAVIMYGSYRTKGNTAELLHALEKKIKSEDIPDLKIKELFIPGLDLKSCHGCLKCKSKGHCVLSDDFHKAVARMIQSDLIILGSPVYFSDVNGPVKNLIDRSISLWHKKELKGKRLIAVAACAESGSGHTIETMKHWAVDQEMEFLAGIEGKGEKKGDILKDEAVMSAIGDVAVVIKGLASPQS